METKCVGSPVVSSLKKSAAQSMKRRTSVYATIAISSALSAAKVAQTRATLQLAHEYGVRLAAVSAWT
jgi:hypothetical protein